MLLSYGGWSLESWADCLPRLLEPLGVRTWRADTGRDAVKLLQTGPRFHIVIVDLRLPLEHRAAAAAGAPPATPAPIATDPIARISPFPAPAAHSEEGGCRLLELLARSSAPPPTVVVKAARSQRDHARDMAESLRHGVFAVMDRPVDMELMLEIFRRVLRRHYHDRWPAA